MKCLPHPILASIIRASFKLSNHLISLISQSSFKLIRHLRKILLHYIMRFAITLGSNPLRAISQDLRKPSATNPSYAPCDKPKLFASQIATCHLA